MSFCPLEKVLIFVWIRDKISFVMLSDLPVLCPPLEQKCVSNYMIAGNGTKCNPFLQVVSLFLQKCDFFSGQPPPAAAGERAQRQRALPDPHQALHR